jgi:hypothetical protein
VRSTAAAARPTPVGRWSRWHELEALLDAPWVVLGAIAVWVGLQAVHWTSFVYFHDAWRHNFPRLYSITKLGGCGDLPRWNGNVDSGWPVIIETVSSATTNAFRLPTLILNGCLGLDVVPALFLYKAEILAMWLVLALGAYVLGRTLFRHRLSAAFVCAAVLFASVGLDDLHSDQDAVILFWLPWILICAVRAHRNRLNRWGAVYFNATILFLCLQAFDHYPHFPLVIATVGAGLYILLYPRAWWEFVRRQAVWLWPAAIPVLITGAEMVIFKSSIVGYVPSQRGDLIIDLSQNGESGWVQPTVLLTSFLPLATLGGFDPLAHNMEAWLQAHGIKGHNLFVFRPNSLIYFMGFIPTLFAILFAIRPGVWRLRAWWLAFTAIIFAISVQETRISYAMFRLPFFDVFRTYSLFGLFPVFAVLVMGGYGVDAFLSLGSWERRRLVRRSLVVLVAGVALSGAVLLALVRYRPMSPDTVALLEQGLAVDLVLMAVGGAALWLAGRSARARLWVVALTAVMIGSQVVYTQEVYHMLGVPLSGVLSKYGLDDQDRAPLPPGFTSDPNAFERKQCDAFGECYLSHRDGVSLRHDDQGTFLRNANEPALQDGLAPEVVRALDGITHPVFWLSSTLQPYSTRRGLRDALNAHAKDIAQHLDQVTYVPAAQLQQRPDLGSTPPDAARLTTLWRGRDVIRLGYTSMAPAYLNAAINHDPHWTATVNGAPVQVLDANFNGLLVPLPPGEGEIVLRYTSPAADFFFYSRYALAAVGVVVVLFMVAGLRPTRRSTRTMPEPAPEFERPPAAVVTG